MELIRDPKWFKLELLRNNVIMYAVNYTFPARDSICDKLYVGLKNKTMVIPILKHI